MSAYGVLLKSLINFSGSKLSTIAEVVNYDVSYISKWCNKGKLPNFKMAPDINRTLANHFSHEILKHDDLSAFASAFSIEATPETLNSVIYNMLKRKYNESNKDSNKESPGEPEHPQSSTTRVLISPNEIRHFFRHELLTALLSYDEPLDILCTLDICRFIHTNNIDSILYPTPSHEINIKFALNTELFFSDSTYYLKQLYYFLNINNNFKFSFYNDTSMKNLNTLVIQNHMAILCAIDQHDRISTAAVITDPKQVNAIYARTLSAFQSNDLLIDATDAKDFYHHGYRTYFYSRDNFQIFLTLGFEYLLPVECWDSITRAARKQLKDDFMVNQIFHLQITWEEIFEKNTVDFFVLKSSLIKYIEDGEIIFADVVYHMSPDERKLHIQKVLEITKKNPNIHFYVIDDTYKPNIVHPLHLSVFNNRERLFLKNTNRYHTEIGPHFYSIHSEQLIKTIGIYFENLKAAPNCLAYDSESIQKAADKYGSLIYRMIDLSAFKAKE